MEPLHLHIKQGEYIKLLGHADFRSLSDHEKTVKLIKDHGVKIATSANLVGLSRKVVRNALKTH